MGSFLWKFSIGDQSEFFNENVQEMKSQSQRHEPMILKEPNSFRYNEWIHSEVKPSLSHTELIHLNWLRILWKTLWDMWAWYGNEITYMFWR